MHIRTIFLCLLLAGCSSLSSTTQNAPTENQSGLLYFLPRQDVVMTVTYAEEPKPKSEKGNTTNTAMASKGDGDGNGNGAENGDKKEGDKEKDEKPKEGEEGKKPEPINLNTGFSGSSGRFTVAISTTRPYPDRAHGHFLQFRTNWIGRNALNIGVSPEGLLQSAKSTTEPGISDALSGIARGVGFAQSMGFGPQDAVIDNCGEVPGVYRYIIELPGADEDTGTGKTASRTASKEECGLTVSARMATTIPQTFAPNTPHGDASGVYYRQSIPYFVTVTGRGMAIAGIVSSPSKSPTFFLPAKSTVFAKNDAELGFENGMPTLYRQETDGEIIGLLKLPADIIGAYFGAVGEIFTNLSKEPSGEAALIQAQMNLEVARFRQEQCRAAIEGSNADAVAATCSAPESAGEK